MRSLRPRPRIKSAATLAVTLAFLATPLALACQYTVRDIGFVDLRGAEYTVMIRGSAPDGFRASVAERLGWLRDTNCRWLFDQGQAEAGAIRVEVVDARGRVLALPGPNKAGGTEGAAAAVPEEAVPEEAEPEKAEPEKIGRDKIGPEEIGRQIRELFETRAMIEIREGAIDAFAQILVIEGTDDERRRRAIEMTERAVVAIRKLEPMLPRPLAKPVRQIRISPDRRPAERLLLWGLGLQELPAERSAVAVIYGRGKLAGRLLVGDDGDGRELLAQLALVGESCECETDRRWTEEPVIPGYWPRDFRQRAASSLGFDPDSPLVRAEVARIVGRGPNSGANRDRGPGGGRSARDAPRDRIEQLLMGYGESELGGETAVDPAGQAGSLGPPDSAARTDATGRAGVAAGEITAEAERDLTGGVRATVITGDGWGFDDEHRAGAARPPGVSPGTADTAAGERGLGDDRGLGGEGGLRGDPVVERERVVAGERPVGATAAGMIGWVLLGLLALSSGIAYAWGRGRP